MADARVRGRLGSRPLRTLVATCLIAGGVVVGSTPVPAAQVASLVASPSPLDRPSALNDVDCVTPTDCFAVGWYTPEQTSEPSALVEHWDGTSWKVVDSPGPAGESTSRLSGVKQQLLESRNTVLEHWNGTKWSLVANPIPASFPSVFLHGVACKATVCFAVGQRVERGDSSTLVERYS